MSDDLPRRAEWWKWALVPLRRYAQFEGRSAPLEFWMYSLFLVVGYVAVAMLGVGLARFAPIEAKGLFISGGVVAFFLVNFIPGLALTARRLHDLGFSGHWIWGIYLAMIFFNIIAWLGFLVAMGIPGRKTENRFGPPVYAQDLAGVFG